MIKKIPFYIWALCLSACGGSSNHSTTPQTAASAPVRNVIFMIGDGMGLGAISTALLSQPTPLALQRATYVGLQTTQSASSDVTDSAAAATALATGEKTRNGSVSVDTLNRPLTSILSRAEQTGRATGLIATHPITDATPAAFVAHQKDRGQEEAIAEEFLTSGIDLFIGGGRRFFEQRQDGRNLSEELRQQGYHIFYSLDSLSSLSQGNVGILLANKKLPLFPDRGDVLPRATTEALRILEKNSTHGFFLMVEGSQIDHGGHQNNPEILLEELIDFDQAVGIAMDYADRHPGTLVVITADHETGGIALPANKDVIQFGKAQPGDGNRAVTIFSTRGHTGSMVPVFAYGTGAERFSGIMDNTDIPKRMAELMGLLQ